MTAGVTAKQLKLRDGMRRLSDDAIHRQALHMADMVSTGIVAQFPNRFHEDVRTGRAATQIRR